MTEVFEKLLISDFDSEDFDVEYYIDYVLDMRVPLWPSVILEIASTFPQLAEKKCR